MRKKSPSHGEVLAEGRREGGQVCLRHHTTGGGPGGWDGGRHTRDARPLGESQEGGGLGVSPHSCAQCVQRGETDSHALGCLARGAQWRAVYL